MKKTFKKIALLCLFVLAVTLANAANTWYVAPNGSNSNPGTINLPFATLQKAHDVAVAGDIIYMRGGTYFPTAQTTLTKSGGTNRIKIWAYQNEKPVIDAINTPPNAWPINLSGGSGWHIKKIEIMNGSEGGITMTSNDNIIENCNIHHNGRNTTTRDGKGISLYGAAANNLILNNDSHHNYNPGFGGEDADGIQYGATGTGNVIRGNRLWRNSDDGFDGWQGSGGLIMENNWAWENGRLDSPTPTQLGDGNGFKLGRPGGVPNNYTLKNNLAWKNLARGFDDNTGTNLTLYNNTAWSNVGNNFGVNTSGHILKNNLSHAGSIGSGTTGTFNSWELAVTVTDADFASLDFSGATGPRQADGSLPVLPFLHLVSGSDLIDKGTNVGIPYNGSAPDLGAFEFTEKKMIRCSKRTKPF